MELLLLTPGTQIPVRIVVENSDYRTLEMVIKGPVEFVEVTIGGKDYDIIVNEVGKITGLAPSLAMAHGGLVTDIHAGRILFAKSNANGDTIGLEKDDIKTITSYFENSTKRCFPAKDFKIPVLDPLDG